MKYSVLIPEERKDVINENVIREIEEKLGVKIHKEGNLIEIDGEGFEAYQAMNIIKAIARGFAPEHAFLLFDENNTLEIIEIPGNKNTLYRIRARLIGRKGIVRKNIERYTKCKIAIYGKTVSIIGPFDKIPIAREAIEMLISGKKHSTMYKYLERLRREGVLE
jgi:ribosomal RNA assembly protein